jgi:hypothetical protein
MLRRTEREKKGRRYKQTTTLPPLFSVFFLTEVPTILAKKTINRRHCDNDENEEGNTKGFQFFLKERRKKANGIPQQKA